MLPMIGSIPWPTSVASGAASVATRLCAQHQHESHINQILPDTVGGDIHPTSFGRLVFYATGRSSREECVHTDVSLGACLSTP